MTNSMRQINSVMKLELIERDTGNVMTNLFDRSANCYFTNLPATHSAQLFVSAEIPVRHNDS